MIQVTKLSKSFGNNQVLSNINLTIPRGKIVGIVGANGAGKTTLFKCIAGLLPHEGNIVADWTPLKEHLGLLLTDPFFFSRMTGKEYLSMLCDARKVAVPDLDRNNLFDLPLSRYASTYSTGMKKKLAITGILLQQNDCFILDEPFNGLDIQSNIMVVDLLHHLRERGKTVLVSSHIFSTLKDTCDEIHVLSEGELVKSVKADAYADLEDELKKDLAVKGLGQMDF